jgi:GlpG protein
MRQIATLPDDAAHKFADYLLTLRIETKLERQDDGTAVWVCDEDRVPQARQELEAFQQGPTDARYGQATAVANEMRSQEERVERAYRRRQKRADEQVAAVIGGGTRLLTLGILALAILVAVLTRMGKRDIVLTQELFISAPRQVAANGQQEPPAGTLDEVLSGQVWRLVTPILLHFSYLHLIFNLLMFLSLGGQVEARRGSLRFLLLLLVLAVASNLTQYYLGHPSIVNGGLVLYCSPYFGGLSGVVYGLFGYSWIKSRREPDLGIQVSTQTVVILLVWFLACFFMDNIANGAHAGGLAAGLLLGAIPTRWRRG